MIIFTKKSKSNSRLLRRNIKVHSEPLKSTAYKTLVRPQLEYCSSVWSPHTETAINQIESVQRRAARWVKHDYARTSSVTEMMSSLQWRPLELRRIDQRLIMFYKIINSLIAIPTPRTCDFKPKTLQILTPFGLPYNSDII